MKTALIVTALICLFAEMTPAADDITGDREFVQAFKDMSAFTLKRVREEARAEADPNSVFPDPTQFLVPSVTEKEKKNFIGRFKPDADKMLVAHTDDGIRMRVWKLNAESQKIEPPVFVFDQLGKPQAGPNLNASLHVLQFVFEKDVIYEIEIDYENVVYVRGPGYTIIDRDGISLYVLLKVAVQTDLAIYLPKVIDAAEAKIPDNDKLTKGSVTFENLDNDDGDTKFDFEDDVVTGGDNELVKIRLQIPIAFASGTVKLTAPKGASDIAVWKQNDKTTASAYTLGTDLAIPADFTAEGGFLVKNMWVEGIAAHSVQQGTILRMTVTTPDITLSDDVALTILGVEKVEWVGRNNSANDTSVLDADPNFPDDILPEAVRVFPDARVVRGSVEQNPRDMVLVKVTLTVAPPHPVKVYLRSFDVDDPSAEGTGNEVDNEGGAWDNRGNPKEGTFPHPGSGDRRTLAFATDVKTTGAFFNVTMQPGDNFRVVASGDHTFLSRLTNDDSSLNVPTGAGNEAIRNANKQRIVDQSIGGAGATPPTREVRKPLRYCSNVLTVWRRLHIEVDTMPAPPSPKPPPDETTGIGVTWTLNAPVAGQSTLRVDRKLPGPANFYADGNIVSGVTSFRIESNTDRRWLIDPDDDIVIRGVPTPAQQALFIGASFTIKDDDETDLPAAFTPLLPRPSLLSPTVSEKFAPAYIAVVDLGALGLNPRATVAFRINGDTGAGNSKDLAASDSNRFWAHLVVAAYQPTSTNEDGDPDNDSGGLTTGETVSGKWSSIFLETIREAVKQATAAPPPLPANRISREIAFNVAHETAHPPGGKDEGPDHAEGGLMSRGGQWDEDAVFLSPTLARLRGAQKWQE